MREPQEQKALTVIMDQNWRSMMKDNWIRVSGGVGLFAMYLWIALFNKAEAAVTNVVFEDNFDGPVLNTNLWKTGNWWLGSRTRLCNQPFFVSSSTNNYAVLPLDTYDPLNPGVAFRGTELVSRSKFTRGLGMIFEARVRVFSYAQPGLVCSFFTYYSSNSIADEADFEFLTQQPLNTVLTTTWNDWDVRSSHYYDKIHHWGVLNTVYGMNSGDWNVLKMVWMPDHMEWQVNGVLIYSTTNALPNDPMSVRANFWAPGDTWTSAYSATLVPANHSAENLTFYYDVDYVRVSAIQESLAAPSSLVGSVSKATVKLAWRDNSSDESGFEVYRAAKPRTGTPVFGLLRSVGANTTTLFDSPGAGTWLYKIRAVNRTEVSAFSNTVQVHVRVK